MSIDSRFLAEADRSARVARKAAVEGRCAACGHPYQRGSWATATDQGTIHLACVEREPSSGERRTPKRRATAPNVTAGAARTTSANRRGRCQACGGTFYAGDTIAFTGRGTGRPIHAACAPQPVNVTSLTPG